MKDITAKRIVIKQDLKKYHSEYRDINICLSGDFIIQDRYGEILSLNEIRNVIELGGSRIHNTIQDDTELLIAANPNDYNNKILEALQMNIYVMSEKEFWESNKQILDYTEMI